MFCKPFKNSKGEQILMVNKRGQDIIHNPLLNKGTAFIHDERVELNLEGLLPTYISTLQEQLLREKENFDAKRSSISHYIMLRALQDRNEVLFYALLRKYIKEMLPIIYTPTVGEAVQMHGHIYRNARGLFISPENVDRIDAMIQSLPSCEIEIIVVTDSEAILGIGDQGVGGMSIPIGKLSLYTAGAGIHPSACLPICLDVGTNNQELLDDPLYLGKRHKRLTGKVYDDFIRDFAAGIKRNFPDAVLQWEDFSKQNAYNNMDRYRKVLPSFNDDVQGTGAVVLGGIIGAMRIKHERLSDQTYTVFGAGAAGVGIARQLRAGLMEESLTEREAVARIFALDSRGLIIDDRTELEEYKKDFAKPRSVVENWIRENDTVIMLEEVLKNTRTTVLIGTSTQACAFNEPIVNLMMDNTPVPVIFPLSNPTSKSEADPRNILEKTNGVAIVASGSPFPSITIDGRERRIGQGNNAFIFPGLGLGAIVSQAKEITDGMFTASAHALADAIPKAALENKCVYPPIEDLFEVSFHVAKAVYLKAVEEGVGTPLEADDLDEAIRDRMWIPIYSKYLFKSDS